MDVRIDGRFLRVQSVTTDDENKDVFITAALLGGVKALRLAEQTLAVKCPADTEAPPVG